MAEEEVREEADEKELIGRSLHLNRRRQYKCARKKGGRGRLI